MLKEAGDRVALGLLRRHQEGGAAVDAHLHDDSGLTEDQEGILAFKRDVDGVQPRAVDDGGNTVGAAQLAGGALAELGASGGFQLLGAISTS